MKHSKYFLVIAALLAVFILNAPKCYAVENNSNIEVASMVDDIFSQGNSFYSTGQSDSSDSSSLGNSITSYLKEKGGIIDLLRSIGYLVFSVVTVVLGLKYVWSGVEGKSQIKETLPTFVIAVVMFYLADNLYSLFSGAASSIIIGKSDFDTVAGGIRATINAVVRVGTMIGIVFLGIKYMLSSASGKADLKNSLLPLVVGMVLVYSATEIVDFIINAGSQVIK